MATSSAIANPIDDDGSGVAEMERDNVLKRGVRADERVPGSGLGLTIVEDLASMYGEKLILEESRLGGLKASLVLPVA